MEAAQFIHVYAAPKRSIYFNVKKMQELFESMTLEKTINFFKKDIVFNKIKLSFIGFLHLTGYDIIDVNGP